MSYRPSVAVVEHFEWRWNNFIEDNSTPLFHLQMIEHYFSKGSYIKPIKAFRGSAKSANTCYAALHRVENQHSHYTLIVSDTSTQAESLVADISDMLRDSSLPYTVVRDVAGEIELLYGGKRYFIVGKGAGSSMRGIKRGRKRPDLIILDDIINDEMVMNRLRVDRLNRWFFKALLPSLDPTGEIYAVGTPLSQNDLFMTLCDLHPTIEIPLTPGVWSDRFSDEWIANKKQEYIAAGMLREFKQEFELVLTDSETRLFDMDKIDFIDEDEVPGNLVWYITLDGAFSEKDAADYSAFACLGLDVVTGMWYVASYDIKSRPQDVIAKLFELQAMYGSYEVGIEKGQFLLSMKSEIDAQQLNYQQYFSVKELNTAGSKISRIKALAPVVNSGRLTLIDTGEPAERLVEQLELTDNVACAAKNDDNLDALCQLIQMDLQIVQDEAPMEYETEELDEFADVFTQ